MLAYAGSYQALGRLHLCANNTQQIWFHCWVLGHYAAFKIYDGAFVLAKLVSYKPIEIWPCKHPHIWHPTVFEAKSWTVLQVVLLTISGLSSSTKVDRVIDLWSRHGCPLLNQPYIEFQVIMLPLPKFSVSSIGAISKKSTIDFCKRSQLENCQLDRASIPSAAGTVWVLWQLAQ